MIWKNKNINKHRVIDSKDLSQNTQEIKLDSEAIRRYKEQDTRRDLDEFEEHRKVVKRSKNKILALIIFLVLVLLVIFGLIFMRYSARISHLESDANKYLTNENYRGAMELYKILYYETGDIEYDKKCKQIESILENMELLKEANSMVTSQDYENAIERLLTISTTDEKLIKNINKLIEDAANKWINEIELLYLKNDLDSAFLQIEKMINILPDNDYAIALREKILNKKNGNQSSSEVATDSANMVAESKKNKRLLQLSKSIIGSEQYVTAVKANVRENHDKNSLITDTLEKGDMVYVEDTFIENSSRMWCKVTYFSTKNVSVTGWILSNELDGSI